jgi:hypothetical protein
MNESDPSIKQPPQSGTPNRLEQTLVIAMIALACLGFAAILGDDVIRYLGKEKSGEPVETTREVLQNNPAATSDE